MNTKVLSLIISVIIGIGLLTLLSLHLSNNKIITDEANRKNANAFDSIIRITKNNHPVFNTSLKGKTIVINVWATWCEPCRKEMPELNKLVKDFASEKVVFLALDRSNSSIEEPKMIKQNIQFDYPKLFNQEVLIEAISSFAFAGEKGSIPLNVVINPKGELEFFNVGYHPEKIKEIREYLSKASGK